jgi:hypothetical protein
MRNTVLIKDFTGIREEFVTAAALSPCHLLEITSAGKVQKHSTASGNVTPIIVALEDNMQGNDVADAYGSGAVAQTAILRSGDRVQMILKDGQNVAIGAKLESAGDGTLQAMALDSTGIYYHEQIVGIAMEAVDMSGSAGVDPDGFIEVMIA